MSKIIIKCWVCGSDLATPHRAVSSEEIDLRVKPCKHCQRHAGAGVMFNVSEFLRRAVKHDLNCPCDDCRAMRIMMAPIDSTCRPDRKKGPTTERAPLPYYCGWCAAPAPARCATCGSAACINHGTHSGTGENPPWVCVECIT